MIFTNEEWEHIKSLVDFDLKCLAILSQIRDMTADEIKHFEVASRLQEKMKLEEEKHEKKNNMDI